MNFEDYMKQYYKEKYGTEDYPKEISRYMGADFSNWMNFKLIETMLELIKVIKDERKN